MTGGLSLQRLNISQCIDTALDRIVLRVDGAAPGRFPRMGFDQHAAMVEPDRLLIGAGRQELADVSARDGIEGFGDLR